MIMKLIHLSAITLILTSLTFTSCKKNQPSYLLEGNFYGNFQGVYEGNDTIVNTGYLVMVEALDKSTALVKGTLFSQFEVLVAKNGLNVEIVSPTDGLTEFLYQGETEKLTFKYENGGNTANYIGTKQ